MRRPLGAFETALTLSDEHAPLNAVGVLRLAGGPETEALRRALTALRERHPLLRARIAREGRGYAYEWGDDAGAVALRRAERDGEDAWVREAETELSHRLDTARGPLWRCVYLPGGNGGECEILLTFHHAIMDASSAVSLCRELLAAASGEGLTGRERARLEAAESYFPPAFRGWRRRLQLGRFALRMLRAEIADRRRARGRWHPPPVGPARCRTLSFQLSEDETAALVRRARRRRLTLNSVLDAAMLLAVARHLYPGESLPLRHLVFADLRPYLEPPVPDEDLGSYFAMLRFTTRVSPKRELFALAGEINAEVRAAGKRGDKYASALTSAATMRGLIRLGTQRMAATALSYTGAARLDPGGPFRVRGLHAFVSNFPLGPEYTAQVRLFAGRLWWDILYLDTELDPAAARRIADEIRALLIHAAETP